MGTLSMEQVAKFIAADNMRDLVAKLVYLQSEEGLSESYLENAKDRALELLFGNSPKKYSSLRPSLFILVAVFGVNFILPYIIKVYFYFT